MATAFLSHTGVTFPNQSDVDDRLGWGFALLLGTTATLFLRPADLMPVFADWPIYQVLIVTTVVVSLRALLRHLSHAELAERPVNICVLTLLLAVGVSHLSHGFLWGARTSMFEVVKLLALYALITGLVNTPQRLSRFVRWLTLAIFVVAGLALLDHFEVISIAALEPIQDHNSSREEDDFLVQRIRGTGIFQDPNDFGLILVTGVILCSAFLTRPQIGITRYMWLLPAGTLLYALALTHSRGALIALLCGVPAVFCYSRRRGLSAWPLLLLPLVAMVFSGRMTDISALDSGTGQARLHIWSDSLAVWRQYPLLGIGEGLLAEETGMAAHNSFLHCFAELGLFGGTAFVACFLAAGMGLWPLRDMGDAPGEADCDSAVAPPAADERELSRLAGFIFGALVAYAAGMLSISRQFVAPTFLILGLAATTPTLLQRRRVGIRSGTGFLFAVLITSAASLLAFYLIVRLFVRR